MSDASSEDVRSRRPDGSGQRTDLDAFADVLAANRRYATGFGLAGLAATAAKELAVLTCIDSRIEPLAMLGLEPGDAKIMRNAGARVTDDALRSLALAIHLLGVSRVLVVPHTRCRMASSSEEEVHQAIRSSGGTRTDEWDFLTITDPEAVLRSDLERIRRCPLVPRTVSVMGAMYDVDTGLVTPVPG